LDGQAMQARPLERRLTRDRALKQSMLDRLRGFAVLAAAPQLPGGQGKGHAAVALAIIDEGHGADLPGLPRHNIWSRQAALLLTRRSGHLRNHAGQWALPGGRIDPGESAEQAALREISEEVNLRLDASTILGRLDDFVTRSGFVMTPVLVWAGAARRLRANPQEVASIHRIPIAEFLRPDAPMLDREEHSEQLVLRMPVGETWIAAPTAAILYQFREICIEGRITRVAHFEQPAFAWK
jgi:8-oxo-dGTP pyrophosphatase MutT (NUDIX family)